MAKKLNLRLIHFVIIFVAFGFGATGMAYIPPNGFILKTWASKHKGVKKLKTRSTIGGFEKDKPISAQFRETVLFQTASGTFRSWATDMKGNKLYFQQGKLSSLPAVTRIFLNSEVRDLIRTLEDQGIVLHKEVQREEVLPSPSPSQLPVSNQNQSLVRWKRSPFDAASPSISETPIDSYAWVVGSESLGDEKALKETQLWFEKDTFLPLRFFSMDKKDADRPVYDFRFEGYRFYREVPFPRFTTVRKGGMDRILSIQLNEVTVDAPEGNEDRTNLQNGFTAVGETASDEMKELIRRYYAFFR